MIILQRIITRMDSYKYFAFISYSWKDKREAKWIQKELERFILPISLRKERPDLPVRIRPVFRDMSDLGIGVLSERIEAALRVSKYLIVLCSPESAQSRWVDQEIRYFLSLGEDTGEKRFGKVLPIIIRKPTRSKAISGGDGTSASKFDFRDCLPEYLRSLSSKEEILAANYSDSGRRYAIVKVVARMLGIEPDSLWQRNRRQRKKTVVLSCALGLFLSALFLFTSRTMGIRIRDLHTEKVIEQARNYIDSQDPITAERMLLSVIPDHLPRKRNAIQSRVLFLLREAEHAYRNEPRILPETKDFWSQLFFLDDRRIGCIAGISDIVNGKRIRFPEEFDWSYCRSFSFSENGTVAFFADHYRVLRYDVLSERLSVLLSDVGPRHIIDITPTRDHRLGIAFELSSDFYEEGLINRDTLAWIVDSKDGTLLAAMEGSVLDDRGEAFYFTDISIDEARHRAFLRDSNGLTQEYDADTGAYLGECDQPVDSLLFDETDRVGNLSSDMPFESDWIKDRGVIISPSLPEPSKRSYVQQGDSLFVLDAEGNHLLSAFCPYPISDKCAERLTREGDPLGRRTILFSPGDQFYDWSLYVLDWMERRVSPIDIPDYAKLCGGYLSGWSKGGNALVYVDGMEVNTGAVYILPLTNSALSLSDYIDFWLGSEMPLSPDFSTALVEGGLYSIDSGALIASIDSTFSSFLFCPGNLFVFKSGNGLTGLDTTDGSIRFHYRDFVQSVDRSDSSYHYTNGDIRQMTPNQRYLGFIHDDDYIVLSLSDGREVLRDPDGKAHLLTDEVLYSYSDYTLYAWSLLTGKQHRFEECPVTVRNFISASSMASIGITPDQEFVLLKIDSESCVFDAKNGKIVAVRHEGEQTERDFKSMEDDYPSVQLLQTVRERYRDNEITKNEIELLLSD